MMVPAVGQGALCIETRADDPAIAPVMERLDHPETRCCVTGERAFLRRIEGSCHIPVACYGRMADQKVVLTAIVASEDGSQIIREQVTASPDTVESHGRKLADTVLEKGGRLILEQLNSHDT